MDVSYLSAYYANTVFGSSFIIKYDTRKYADDNADVVINLSEGTEYDFFWSLSDGQTGRHTTDNGENLVITTSSPDIYTLSILWTTGVKFDRIHGADDPWGKCWLEIISWGDFVWEYLGHAFQDFYNLKISPSDVPTISPTTNVDFKYCFSNIGTEVFPRKFTFGGAQSLYATFSKTAWVTFPTLDYTGITYFSSTWLSCRELTDADLVDAKDATDIRYVFRDCWKLKHGPIRCTDKVTYSRMLYAYCYKLTSYEYLELRNSTNIDYLFYHCRELTEHRMLDTRNVQYGKFAFNNNRKVEKFPLFDLRNLINGDAIFSNNSGTLTIPEYQFESATSLSSAFNYNIEVTEIKIYTPVVVNISYIFALCYSVTSLDGCEFPLAENCKQAFYKCRHLIDFDFRTLNLKAATDLEEAFDLQRFNTDNPLSTQRYSELLVWLEANNPNDNVPLGAGVAKYNNSAVDARNSLINRGWTILDGGLGE